MRLSSILVHNMGARAARSELELTLGSCISSFTLCWNHWNVSLPRKRTLELRCQTVQGARQQPAWRISSSDSLRLQACHIFLVQTRTSRRQQASLLCCLPVRGDTVSRCLTGPLFGAGGHWLAQGATLLCCLTRQTPCHGVCPGHCLERGLPAAHPLQGEQLCQ